MQLTSQRHMARDEEEAARLVSAQGWTDGLPVVVPTPARVREMLRADGRPGPHILAQLPEQGTFVTLEQVAVNAVLAGCSPRSFPVVAAIIEAMGDDRFNLHSTTVSGATAPLAIVGGEAVDAYGLNDGFSLFGPGPSAGPVIGRAVRLVLQNACGGVPGTVDKSTFGHPGKFSYCIGESHRHLPSRWLPLHEACGLHTPGGVTVASADAPIQVRNDWATGHREVLTAIADVMSGQFTGGTYIVILGPRHAATVDEARWSRSDVAEFIYDASARPVAELVRRGRIPGSVSGERLHATRQPQDILLTVAGGHLYGYSAVLPPWVGGHESAPVSVPIPPPLASDRSST